jgi:hypothetical protein
MKYSETKDELPEDEQESYRWMVDEFKKLHKLVDSKPIPSSIAYKELSKLLSRDLTSRRDYERTPDFKIVIIENTDEVKENEKKG